VRGEGLQAAAIDVLGARRPDDVAGAAVRLLAAEPNVVLARVWVASGSKLHLAASAGSPSTPGQGWDGVDGADRAVDKIATGGAGMLLHDMSSRSAWMARPDWARSEGIQSFAGQPVVHERRVLGVVAVFARARIDTGAFAALRGFADVVAAALAGARVVDELERRCARLELENAALRGAGGRDPGVTRLLRDLTILVERTLVFGDGGADEAVSAVEWRRRERANLEAALRRAGGRVYGMGGAAEILGVPPTTFASRLKALREGGS
jgi:transcriptional regulator with GAF, ATPase, and Fis domain